MVPSDSYRRIAAALLRGKHDPQVLEELSNAIDNNDAKALVQALVELRGTEAEGATGVVQAMTALESLMSVAPKTAGVLMARLYSLADAAFMHEVCDAIELWIESIEDPEFTSALRTLSRHEADAGSAARYERWAAQLEQRRPSRP